MQNMMTETSLSGVVRQVKIDLIIDRSNPIVDWFNSIWNGMAMVKCDVYQSGGQNQEVIYYKIDPHTGVKQWMFFHDIVFGSMWINYNHYWLILKEKGFEYEEIRQITKLMLGNYVEKCKNYSPILDEVDLENFLINVINTPNEKISYAPLNLDTVDKTLNNL